LKDVADGFIGCVHVDKVNLIFFHGWKAEMGKQVVVKIDVRLSRVEHHPVTIKDNSAYFLISAHDYSFGEERASS
jgi:hypothetical protein